MTPPDDMDRLDDEIKALWDKWSREEFGANPYYLDHTDVHAAQDIVGRLIQRIREPKTPNNEGSMPPTYEALSAIAISLGVIETMFTDLFNDVMHVGTILDTTSRCLERLVGTLNNNAARNSDELLWEDLERQMREDLE